MKTKTMLATAVLVISSATLMANGGGRSTDMERKSKTETTRERMEENPRNSSFPGSFGQVGSSKEEQQEKNQKESKHLDEVQTIDRDLRY